MKHQNEKEHGSSSARILPVLVAVLTIVLVGLIITAMILDTHGGSGDRESTAPQTTTKPQSSNVEITGGYLIQTPVADLYISEMWEELVRVEKDSEGDSFMASVFSTGEAPEVLLFTIVIGGEPQEGMLLGQAVNADGALVDVCIQIPEIPFGDDWEPGVYDTLCAIQESVNDIIQQIYALPGFKPAQ